MTTAWAWLSERWHVEDTVLTDSGDNVWLIIAVAAAVFIATMIPQVWSVFRFAPTVIHEMGHVIVATLTGRKVSGIKVHNDESGVTTSRGKPNGIGMLLTVLAGYPAPAVFATILAFMSFYGYAGMALTLYNLVIILALLLCRNFWGFISCISAAILTIGISIWNDPNAVSWTVLVLIVFYSLTGIRGSFGLFRVHFSHFDGGVTKKQRKAIKENRQGSDAHQAWQQTLIIPPAVWVFIFIGVNIALTVVNGYILLS